MSQAFRPGGSSNLVLAIRGGREDGPVGGRIVEGLDVSQPPGWAMPEALLRPENHRRPEGFLRSYPENPF
jgi:hypothetical protein